MKIGIGLITYDRPVICLETAQAIASTVSPDTNLVCAIDGGNHHDYDPWLFEHFEVIMGKNSGVVVNKNRAINYLQHCDYVFLIEDDFMPIQPGWVELSIHAMQAANLDHLTLVTEDMQRFSSKLSEQTFEDVTIEYWEHLDGQFMAMTRKCIETVGILDPNYVRFGHGHVDYTRRCAMAGFYPKDQWINVRSIENHFKFIYTEGIDLERRQEWLDNNTKRFVLGSPQITWPLKEFLKG